MSFQIRRLLHQAVKSLPQFSRTTHSLTHIDRICNMKVIARKARESDLEDVYSLLSSFVSGYNSRIILVLESQPDATIAGYALFHFGYDTCIGKYLHLEDLFVVQEFRSASAGLLLMKTLAMECEAQDCVLLRGMVSEQQPQARRFYESCGAVFESGKLRSEGIDWHEGIIYKEDLRRFKDRRV